MSAPDGDLERQTKHHRGPLRGMMAVVLFALTMLAILTFWAFGRGDDPQGSVAQNQEGVGEEMTTAADDAITANDNATDDGASQDGAVATQAAEDPSAVTVPSQVVENPQSGIGSDDEQNPDVGDSDTAEPLDPVEGEEANGQGPTTD